MAAKRHATGRGNPAGTHGVEPGKGEASAAARRHGADVGDYTGWPKVHETAYVDPMAVVSGKVTLGRDVSIWPGAILRGDMEPITLGDAANVQDNCVVHTDIGFPVTIGEGATLGHGAIVHGATVERMSLIGIGAVVLNGAVIGEGSIVGAGAIVTEGMQVPPGSLVLGVPGKITKQGVGYADRNANNRDAYVILGRAYKAGKVPRV